MQATTKILAQQPARTRRLVGAATTLLLHAIGLSALLHYEPFREALRETAPIMVSLITPEVDKPRAIPKPVPVKSKVEPVKLPPPLITAISEAPSPVAPAPQPPAPPQAAPVEVLAPPKAITEAPPPPVIPPVFNADYLDNPPPAYPAISRRTGEQGRVMVRVLVSTKGIAEKVEIRTSSGSGRLDEAAMETIKRWRFVPARQGDLPVAAWVLIPISFALKG